MSNANNTYLIKDGKYIPQKGERLAREVFWYADLCRQAAHNKAERMKLDQAYIDAKESRISKGGYNQLLKFFHAGVQRLERERLTLIQREQALRPFNLHKYSFVI